MIKLTADCSDGCGWSYGWVQIVSTETICNIGAVTSVRYQQVIGKTAGGKGGTITYSSRSTTAQTKGVTSLYCTRTLFQADLASSLSLTI